MGNIHITAQIEEGAVIAPTAVIEAFVVIKKDVVIEDFVTIKSFSYIDGFTTIGAGTTVWPNVSIGTKTQHLQYDGAQTFVRIGKRCEIREFVTINSSFAEGTTVEVGDDCLIMAYCHVAHSSTVGNNVVLTNSVNLAGHVSVGDYAIIGGMTAVHQNVRIGSHTMVGGMSRVTHDVPPYTLGAGYPYVVSSINAIGLKRRGFALEDRLVIHAIFTQMYKKGYTRSQAIEKLESNKSPFAAEWVEFFKASKRGVSGISAKARTKQEQVAH